MATSEKIRHLLVLLVAGLMASVAESAKIEDYLTSQAERIQFIQAHNKYRSDFDIEFKQPSASNMNRMYWNMYLEATAYDWARQCKDMENGQTKMKDGNAFKNFTETYGSAFGQNLFKATTTIRPNATSIIDSFMGEATDFTYSHTSRGDCSANKTCSHYTQVVWADSYLFGCGFYQCRLYWLSVCNYVPAGNLDGVPPYKLGLPCSECASTKSGFKDCANKLCVPTDRCSPVTECKVVDLENCLCSEEENKMMAIVLISQSHLISNYQIASVGPTVIILSLLASAAVLFDVTL